MSDTKYHRRSCLISFCSQSNLDVQGYIKTSFDMTQRRNEAVMRVYRSSILGRAFGLFVRIISVFMYLQYVIKMYKLHCCCVCLSTCLGQHTPVLYVLLESLSSYFRFKSVSAKMLCRIAIASCLMDILLAIVCKALLY